MTRASHKLLIGLILTALAVPVVAVSSVSAERYNNNDRHHNQYHNEDKPDCSDDLVEIPRDNELYSTNYFNNDGMDRHNRHHKQNQEVTCVTATPATSVDPTCDQLGFYIIPTTVGVNYTVDGQVVAAGNHTVPNGTTVTIVAVAQQGYAFDQGTPTSWTYTINAPTGCVTATTASATTPTPQVKVVPTGGVYAGGGGAQNSSAALFGLIGSTTALAVGLVRKFVA